MYFYCNLLPYVVLTSQLFGKYQLLGFTITILSSST